MMLLWCFWALFEAFVALVPIDWNCMLKFISPFLETETLDQHEEDE